MKNMIDIISAAGLGIAVVAASFAASADEQERPSASRNLQTRSIEVAYSDLNLSRQAGVEVLYSRLEIAAEKACAPEEDRRQMLMRRDWKRCVSTALDNAVGGTGIPELQQVHLFATGRQVNGTISAIAKVK